MLEVTTANVEPPQKRWRSYQVEGPRAEVSTSVGPMAKGFPSSVLMHTYPYNRQAGRALPGRFAPGASDAGRGRSAPRCHRGRLPGLAVERDGWGWDRDGGGTSCRRRRRGLHYDRRR